MPDVTSGLPILGICLAHLIQLAIKDFLDSISSSYSKALEITRELVKNCRTPNVKAALSKEKCSMLSLDVPTRLVKH